MYDELVKNLRYEATWQEDFPETQKLMIDSADAIEALSKKYLDAEVDNTNLTGWLAEEYAKRLWIPVTERLPEEDERVLVVAHRINDNSPVVCIDSVEADEGELKFSLYRGVDYWMPLPERPGGGES